MIEVTIAHDKAFNSLSEFAQLLYLRTLPHTDDYGRFEADVDVFKARVDPFGKRPIEDYETAMKEIAELHLWSIYRVADDKLVLQFDSDTFERINAFLIKNRGNCEYPAYMDSYQLICGDMPAYTIESKEYKEERRKKKETDVDNFESVWKRYPNHSGKKAALRHYTASVTTPGNIADINKALENYLRSGNVLRGFVKNGSTWFNEWQDWVEPTNAMMKGNTEGKAALPSGPRPPKVKKCAIHRIEYDGDFCPKCYLPKG